MRWELQLALLVLVSGCTFPIAFTKWKSLHSMCCWILNIFFQSRYYIIHRSFISEPTLCNTVLKQFKKRQTLTLFLEAVQMLTIYLLFFNGRQEATITFKCLHAVSAFKPSREVGAMMLMRDFSGTGLVLFLCIEPDCLPFPMYCMINMGSDFP